MRNIRIKKLGKEDLATASEMFLALQIAFGLQHPSIADDDYLARLLSNEGFMCFAAIMNETVIGGLTAYELPMYHAAYSECYVYDVGVKPEYQRMGAGRQLIAELKAYCGMRNIKTMFVEAQMADNDAIEFYRSTGASEEGVVHFNYDI